MKQEFFFCQNPFITDRTFGGSLKPMEFVAEKPHDRADLCNTKSLAPKNPHNQMDLLPNALM